MNNAYFFKVFPLLLEKLIFLLKAEERKRRRSFKLNLRKAHPSLFPTLLDILHSKSTGKEAEEISRIIKDRKREKGKKEQIIERIISLNSIKGADIYNAAIRRDIYRWACKTSLLSPSEEDFILYLKNQAASCKFNLIVEASEKIKAA